MRKLRVILPAYNEELSLPSLLKKLNILKKTYDLDIVVVNDGSTDNTLRKAIENEAEVLDLQPNRGLAGAMKAGLTEGIRGLNDDDLVITMDADDSHDPEVIHSMIRKIDAGADLVIASRYREGSKIKGLAFYRQLFSIGAAILFKSLRSIKGVRDYTCGYRCYKASLLKSMNAFYKENLIQQKGFGCMAELLLKARRFQPVIKEVPFVLRYDLKLGNSKMKLWKTVRQTLSLLFLKGT